MIFSNENVLKEILFRGTQAGRDKSKLVLATQEGLQHKEGHGD